MKTVDFDQQLTSTEHDVVANTRVIRDDRLPPEQKAVGSNPTGRTTPPIRINNLPSRPTGVIFCFGHVFERF